MHSVEIVDRRPSWCVSFQARDPTTLSVVTLASRTPEAYSMRTVAALRARPSSNRRPGGLWTLPGLPVPWTRKRTRAHSPLENRPNDRPVFHERPQAARPALSPLQ